ncbi:hypothetical protein MH117_10340 [Paenibacillus sp. ACRRX]|uniref:hypothetical protein n=1 Tax=unclassified Paenibacillus TaxID=185978 RepID=UPI001EF3E9D5|nr:MULTISPECIES: hypothetical protein [unclassified Paenibacillus]MCG7407821.1 hypothetical protein [Paenibacillus sp. ACRRX]MDK8180964.1 hypothetical protein [Paenibacillus sp. UMB4589-SE434]
MKLSDALFNWLQMDIVSSMRPYDVAAKETFDFFAVILYEDHQIRNVKALLTNEDSYVITYELDGQQAQAIFDRQHAEQLWHDIESNPKYNE